MRLRAALVIASLSALAVHAAAQAPRDARAVRTGTATLGGVVVSDDSEGKPVRRARVTCIAPELTEGLTAITDDRGRFTCDRLPAGRYTVSATREGWVPVAYGARRPLRPGTPVRLGEGRRAEIVVRMMRGAVITGTLLDGSGQPAVNTGVVALRSTLQNGERRLVASGVPGTTDDQGVYRIYALAPGDYFVGSAPNSRGGSDLRATSDLDVYHARTAGPPALPPPDRSVAFASTYFPGTSFASQATAISLGPGEERGGVDFALQLVTTVRVEGAVSTPDGSPVPANAQITLLASGQTAFPGVTFDGLRTAGVAGDGAFAFAGIAPGIYTVLARAGGRDETPLLWASQEIAVDGERVSGLSLTLQPGMTLAGQVRFDSRTGQRSFPAAATRVTLQPVPTQDGARLTPASVTPDAGGRFRISGVTPGRYRLIASLPGSGRPGGWGLRSAVVNGQDTLDMPLVIQPGQALADAVITFSDQLAEIAGTVSNAAGVAAPDNAVVLFPTEEALWLPQARRIHGVRPAADGTYQVPNLPPGRYMLATVDDAEPGEWFDPAFLQRLLPAAAPVVLSEGEHLTVNLRTPR